MSVVPEAQCPLWFLPHLPGVRGSRSGQQRPALPPELPRSHALPCPASHGKMSEVIFSDQEVRLRLKEGDGEPSACPGGSAG